MNKRIKELIEQATIRGEAYLPGDNGHPTPTEYFDKEKFAQSIVLECIQVCADRGTHHDGLYSAWAVDCSERIGKHFGVEEQTASQKMAAAGYTRRPRGWTKEE